MDCLPPRGIAAPGSGTNPARCLTPFSCRSVLATACFHRNQTRVSLVPGKERGPICYIVSRAVAGE